MGPCEPKLRGGWALAALVFALAPRSACAQTAVELTLASGETYRGESIARADPVARIALSVDHKSGVYAGGSASVAAGAHDPRLAASTQYLGYAARRGGTTFEVGVVHSHFRTMTDLSYNNDFFQGFAGVARKTLRLRVYASRDYLRDGRTTWYGEFNARLARFGSWSLGGHAGLSRIPADPGEPRHWRSYHDASLTLARSFGAFNFSAAATATDYPVIGTNQGPKFTAALSRAF